MARALADTLVGSRVRAILLDPDAGLVLLHLRDRTLAFELHPSRGWISVLPPSDPLPEARATSARVSAVRSLPDDSVVVVDLARKNGKLELVLEFVGSRWNACVVDGDSRIVRSVLFSRKKGSRRLAVGDVYAPPPTTGRRGVDGSLDKAEWEVLSEAAGPVGADRKRAVLARVAWTSSLNVDALLGDDGWERWRGMTDPSRWSAFLLGGGEDPQPYPVPVPERDFEPMRSLLEAFRVARERSSFADPPSSLLVPSRLLARVDARVKRARSRASALRRELEFPADPSSLREKGDLILARFHEIPRGRPRVTLSGFDGAPIEIEMDPSLSPQDNAARWYAEAGRIERARSSLPRRIAEADAEGLRWGDLAARVRAGEIPWVELEEALGPERARPGRGPLTQRAALPYRRFTSSSGLEIRVGRGARDNDELTFHHSAPDDIWLHARHTPGAHVILRWGREEGPPRRDLLEAATLAALHSDARGSASVPVVWTRRKHVRKPRKAASGAVLPDRGETLMVEPDAELAGRLEWRPGRG